MVPHLERAVSTTPLIMWKGGIKIIKDGASGKRIVFKSLPLMIAIIVGALLIRSMG